MSGWRGNLYVNWSCYARLVSSIIQTYTVACIHFNEFKQLGCVHAWHHGVNYRAVQAYNYCE